MGKRIICFDLEGPLSPQDNAYEVLSLAENGEKIFEVISKYDDIIALEKREGYEPGDTLALIVPFLLLNEISEKDIESLSKRAKIVDGAKELISKLHSEGWNVYIISTSYEQHAHNIGSQLNVPKENITCTKLPLEELKANVGNVEMEMIKNAEREIIQLYPHMDDDEKIVSLLDRFFFDELPKTSYGKILEKVKVVGGKRKVQAIDRIVKENEAKLSDIVAVGDSITDYKMLKEVRDNGGLAVVFNGNEYAIPYANIGLASSDIRFLHLLLRDYNFDHKRGHLIETVKSWEIERDRFERDPKNIPDSLISQEIKDFLIESGKILPYFHYLGDKPKLEGVINIHKRFRNLVRGEAAKLG
ncbi:HAD family hydrolase [Halobacteriota archaeon]